MDLSIVTTLYQSAPYLEEFYTRTCAVAENVANNFEIIFVNDGSPDNSLELAISLYRANPRVKVIDLSRNFGHHKAMMTGLAHARGELVFLIDSDLEEEPELLDSFYKELIDGEADVVYGVQKTRKGNFLERISGALFFKIFNALSTHSLTPNLITARLMSKRYVSALLRHTEREVLIAGLWALTGFKQIPVIVKKHSRKTSSYSIAKRAAHLVNGITSFSNMPLVLIFYIGSIIIFLSSLAAIDLIVRRIFFGELLEGWASLIVSIWLLGGITIFCLGVIGIYLAKVFTETKQRPYTIIRDVFEHRIPVSLEDESGADRERYKQAANTSSDLSY